MVFRLIRLRSKLPLFYEQINYQSNFVGNYYQVTSGHCTSVTEPECKALAHHRNVEFHDIRNPHLNLYPRGCYYNKDKNLFYFNPAASTHLCTSKRICICKKNGRNISPNEFGGEWGRVVVKMTCVPKVTTMPNYWLGIAQLEL